MPGLPHHDVLGRDHEGSYIFLYPLNSAQIATQLPSLALIGCLFTDPLHPQVWDIAEDAPKCVQEREMKLGRLHCAEGCPDAPFVVCMGGDKNSDNLKVLDVRESADGE